MVVDQAKGGMLTELEVVKQPGSLVAPGKTLASAHERRTNSYMPPGVVLSKTYLFRVEAARNWGGVWFPDRVTLTERTKTDSALATVTYAVKTKEFHAPSSQSDLRLAATPKNGEPVMIVGRSGVAYEYLDGGLKKSVDASVLDRIGDVGTTSTSEGFIARVLPAAGVLAFTLLGVFWIKKTLTKHG